jgi:hypothetical protein
MACIRSVVVLHVGNLTAAGACLQVIKSLFAEYPQDEPTQEELEAMHRAEASGKAVKVVAFLVPDVANAMRTCVCVCVCVCVLSVRACKCACV